VSSLTTHLVSKSTLPGSAIGGIGKAADIWDRQCLELEHSHHSWLTLGKGK
jgi:hypothetical protein